MEINTTTEKTLSTKQSKCLESESLLGLIENKQLDIYENMLFAHDYDLSDQKLLVEKNTKAEIKYNLNHFTKKAKR